MLHAMSTPPDCRGGARPGRGGGSAVRQRRALGGLGRLAIALVLSAGAGGWQRALAAVDLNGLWHVGLFVTRSALTFSDVCSLNIIQAGDTLALSGSCRGAANPVSLQGTLDPTTLAFSGSGTAGACGAVTITGSVAFNFISFTGAFDCPSLGVSGGINASRCGNGQIDPCETCDDGNLV